MYGAKSGQFVELRLQLAQTPPGTPSVSSDETAEPLGGLRRAGGIIVGPRKMMRGPVHQHRSLRFLVDHVDEAKATLLVKHHVGREAAGENQQAARHQQLLELGPGEQAVAALDASVLGAVRHDVHQTCSAPEGADEAGFGVVRASRQRRSALVEQAMAIGLVVHQVAKGRQILWVCTWASMADAPWPHRRRGAVLYRGVSTIGGVATVDAVLVVVNSKMSAAHK